MSLIQIWQMLLLADPPSLEMYTTYLVQAYPQHLSTTNDTHRSEKVCKHGTSVLIHRKCDMEPEFTGDVGNVKPKSAGSGCMSLSCVVNGIIRA